MITAGVIEPLMRASLCLENEVRNYKRVLLTAIDLCEMSDNQEQYEALCELSVSSPALYSFFKPDPLQDRVLNCLNNLSFDWVLLVFLVFVIVLCRKSVFSFVFLLLSVRDNLGYLPGLPF